MTRVLTALRGPEWKLDSVMELPVMSYCRAHRESAPRLVKEWRDPLAPDTDLHHRTIQKSVVDCRTDGVPGRDEKDVGVRSCGCGVARRKVLLDGSQEPREKLTRIPEPDSVRKARVLRLRSCKEWYYRPAQLSSNYLNGRVWYTYCPATSPGYFSRMTEQLADPLPALERAVEERPDDARALVALANHYWLIGAGPEVVGDLASRAISADPANRAGWHLWALAESNPRERVARWQQVAARFPDDELARVNLADNAASLAGAEHDYEAVDLAIATYESLRATARHPDQIAALDKAIQTLQGWKF